MSNINTMWSVMVEADPQQPGGSVRKTEPQFESFVEALAFYQWSITNPGVFTVILQVWDGSGRWETLSSWYREDEDDKVQALADELVNFAKEVSTKDPVWDGKRITPPAAVAEVNHDPDAKFRF